ncbi:HRDC domain-containing protein [Deinococcus radiophilus]|uniref:HRDC domain-containing protein n=1 Tax=Deinococcus radiophilus TaxID=32062 RepID=A0A3S0RE91_9DEIO|nr:HRDC domain-containing protein [Deinococcus radiophilus]RTR26244.1 hypothetical protein EJ104_08715 [Deinococcus radiophilus]UFA50304.1 HRDC domain-containing protein [Deinococcus radiophilus]
MTNADSLSGASSAGRRARPDTRLISLHTERGDAHTRLEQALADLEGADWGLTLAGEQALAQQLRSILGAGVLRLDPRLPVRRNLLAEAGLAAAGLEGDWQGAGAVWLLEPQTEDIQRAQRAGVRVIVDTTLAPGGQWLQLGADLLTYHHAATLTGFAAEELALLFGLGERPRAAAPAAADLTVALALRDVATLPLRLARAAQTVSSLEGQMQGRALPLGPTALLLPPEAAATTAAPLGGVLPAARAVMGGVILTPGLADARQVRELLRGEMHQSRTREQTTPRQERRSEPHEAALQTPASTEQESRPREGQTREQQPREARLDPQRGHRRQDQRQQDTRRFQRTERSEPPRPPQSSLDRFVFEAPARSSTQATPNEDLSGPTPVPSQPSTTHQPAAPVPQENTRNRGRDGQNRKKPDSRPAEQSNPERTEVSDAAPLTPLAPDLPTVQDAAQRPDPAADLSEEQATVFARLRDWRNAEASRQEISRFIVASNATLAEIARQVPYTQDDLASIKGMGPARLSKYGEAILQVVRGEQKRR